MTYMVAKTFDKAYFAVCAPVYLGFYLLACVQAERLERYRSVDPADIILHSCTSEVTPDLYGCSVSSGPGANWLLHLEPRPVIILINIKLGYRPFTVLIGCVDARQLLDPTSASTSLRRLQSQVNSWRIIGAEYSFHESIPCATV